MLITAYFSQNGAPKTGLTPTIKIWDATNDSQVVSTAMTEIDDTETSGWYKYSFTANTPTIDYVYYIDGGATLAASERYASGSSAGLGLTTEVESTITLGEMLRVMFSWMTGLSSGGGSDLVQSRDYLNSKPRVSMWADERGNRSKVTLDGS